MTLTLHIPDATHTAVQQRVRDLGFKSISAYLRWKLDEDLTIAAYRAKERVRKNPRNPEHSTYLPNSIRSRVMELPVGSRFTVDDIVQPKEDRASVGVTLHYLHRAGIIGLKSSAKRTNERGGWEPAVFVRVSTTNKGKK